MKTLIFAYYSIKDPVFVSAVMPYFINFPGEKNRFVLVTWENSRFPLSKEEITAYETLLEKNRIKWVRLTWHSGRLKIFKKIYDLLVGIITCVYLVFRHRVRCVYSEGAVGAMISHYICKLTGKSHIVHSFEPHTEYMIEGGVWKESDWEARLGKKMEKTVALGADFLVTATHAYKERLIQIGVKPASIYVCPSCVDTSYYRFSADLREQVRLKHGVKPQQKVVTYIGKLGGMYMKESLFHLYSNIKKSLPEKPVFWLFTNEPPAEVHKLIKQFPGLAKEDFLVKFLDKKEIPAYLSGSDLGVVAVKPYHSKRYCSPIKTGEYWSCGLPVLIPVNVSDDYLFVQEDPKLGYTLQDLSETSYLNFCESWKEDQASTELRAYRHSFVKRNRDITIYQNQLLQMFGTLSTS